MKTKMSCPWKLHSIVQTFPEAFQSGLRTRQWGHTKRFNDGKVLIYETFQLLFILYIFLLYHIYHLCFTCIEFYDLSAWNGCWFDVYIKRVIYKFLNVCPFVLPTD